MIVTETYNQSINLFLNAFTILASIAWKDVISYFIDKIEYPSEKITYKVGLAIILTFISFIAINILKPKFVITTTETSIKKVVDKEVSESEK